MRFLLEAITGAERDRVCGYGGYRALYHHAVAYVDALWGTTPRG